MIQFYKPLNIKYWIELLRNNFFLCWWFFIHFSRKTKMINWKTQFLIQPFLNTTISWYNHSLIQSFLDTIIDSKESIRIAIQTQNWLIISTIHYQVFIIIILNISMLFIDTNNDWLKYLLSKYLSNNLITWFVCIQKHLRAFLMLNQ